MESRRSPRRTFHCALSLPFDAEPYGPGDNEYAAGQRLLAGAVAGLGVRSIDYLGVEGGASALADASGRGGRFGAPAIIAPPREPIHYRVIDSYFASNRRLMGLGSGARLQYQDIDPSFLELIGTKSSEQKTTIERDQTRRGYLQPIAGSEAAKAGAGLFLKPGA